MISPTTPIKDRPIRIALVGCGRISANHIRAIAIHSERAKLVAICDTKPERLQSARQLLNEVANECQESVSDPIPFSSFHDLLEAVRSEFVRVDLVVLATPSGLHAAQTVAAAALGIHVCTEKPMATRWEDGIRMVRACDEAGVQLFVIKQNRFNTTLQLLKRQLEAGRFGRLSMVVVNVFWQRPQSYYDQAPWRGTWEFDGGALMNQASHYVDLLHWLVGPVMGVSASIATIGRSIETEDTAALQLRWRNGALGTMAVTMLTYPNNLEGSITLLGEKGTVVVGGTAVNEIKHWQFADSRPDDELVEDSSYVTNSVYGYGHHPYYENVLDSLQGVTVPVCDGRDGLHSLELLVAAYRSARDQHVVHLPLEL